MAPSWKMVRAYAVPRRISTAVGTGTASTALSAPSDAASANARVLLLGFATWLFSLSVQGDQRGSNRAGRYCHTVVIGHKAANCVEVDGPATPFLESEKSRRFEQPA